MRPFWAVSLATIIGCSCAHMAYGGSLLPETLRQAARDVGCSEVEDFYNRPGRIDPPYVFGYLRHEKDPYGEHSAVFWCARPAQSEKYLLVVWVDRDVLPIDVQKCPGTVRWQNYPGGISIVRGERMPLSEFWYREDPKKAGPADAFTVGPMI